MWSKQIVHCKFAPIPKENGNILGAWFKYRAYNNRTILVRYWKKIVVEINEFNYNNIVGRFFLNANLLHVSNACKMTFAQAAQVRNVVMMQKLLVCCGEWAEHAMQMASMQEEGNFCLCNERSIQFAPILPVANWQMPKTQRAKWMSELQNKMNFVPAKMVIVPNFTHLR